MSYLRNKEIRNKKILRVVSIAAALVLLFIFRAPVGRGFGAFAHGVAWPFLEIKKGISTEFSKISTAFSSKSALVSENESLKQQLEEARVANREHDILLDDNITLRRALGRAEQSTSTIAGVILAKPNASPYGTLIIDIGSDKGITEGAMVFAEGTVPIGTIDAVYGSTSRVKLFSTPKETTKVALKNGVYIDVIGNGAGNFKATLPRDIAVAEGDVLSLPNIAPKVLAVIGKIVSDPRDPFQTILAISPVNVQELKFVEVSIK